MSLYLGDFKVNKTVYLTFGTNNKNGASVGFDESLELNDFFIYKNGGTTQRASTSGVTFSENFDSTTGEHLLTIDLSDNADPGFYAPGNDYFVMMDPSSSETIDGEQVNTTIGHFSIQNRYNPGEFAQYQGKIWFDSSAPANTNTVFGIDGTPTNPVTSVAALKTLMDSSRFRKAVVRGTLTWAQAMDGYSFEAWVHGVAITGSPATVNLTTAVIYQNLKFLNLRVYTDTNAQVKESNYHKNCMIGYTGKTLLGGTYLDCIWDMSNGVNHNELRDNTNVINPTYTGPSSKCYFSYNGAPATTKLKISRLSGWVNIRSMTNGSQSLLITGCDSTRIELDATITNGLLELHGIYTLQDSKTGGFLTQYKGEINSDLYKIRGDALSGNNATLNLKQLNIINNAGDALIAKSTGGDGHGMNIAGEGAGHGALYTGGDEGHGVKRVGGSVEGDGEFSSGGGSGRGASYIGTDGNTGLVAQGDGNGNGIQGISGVNGDGVVGTAQTTGSGIKGFSTSGKDLDASEIDNILSRLGTPSDLGSGANISANLFDLDASSSSIKAITDLINFDSNDNVLVSLEAILGSVIGESSSGRIANNWDSFWDNSDSSTTKEVDDVGSGNPSAIADAVWDEPRAGHVSAGTFGEYTNSNLTRIKGTTTVDTMDIGTMFTNMIAALQGDVVRVGNNYSFKKQDGTTEAFQFTTSAGGRT